MFYPGFPENYTYESLKPHDIRDFKSFLFLIGINYYTYEEQEMQCLQMFQAHRYKNAGIQDKKQGKVRKHMDSG